MIRHIVMWKLDDSYSQEEKTNFVNAFSEKLRSLDGKIPQLKSISTHINAPGTPTSNYDLLLDTSFNSIADLETYATHPDHVAVVEFSKSHKKERSCVDYEC